MKKKIGEGLPKYQFKQRKKIKEKVLRSDKPLLASSRPFCFTELFR